MVPLGKAFFIQTICHGEVGRNASFWWVPGGRGDVADGGHRRQRAVPAGHRLHVPERIAAVAMPAPTSSAPPVRLKTRMARGLRTTLRARDATSA